MIRSRPYIYWLQENASEPQRKQEVGPYERHRRLVAYDTDQSALAGYRWENPLTGHNYAYLQRVDIKLFDQADRDAKQMAWAGVACILLSGAYLYHRGGWKLALWPLGLGVAATEAIGGFLDYMFSSTFPTLEKLIEEFNKYYQQGEPTIVQLVDDHSYGDVEYAAGKLWQTRLPRSQGGDGLSQTQGSSIVSSAGSGACLHRLVFDGGFSKSWLSIILGLLGIFPLVDNVLTWWKVGDKLETGGESIAHGNHLIGQVLGVSTSWVLKHYFKV